MEEERKATIKIGVTYHKPIEYLEVKRKKNWEQKISLEEILNKYGRHGWELCAFIPERSPGTAKLIFKRLV